ncbi:MAG: acyl--CoA ligase [Clostridia bacterium]|nr:acyl--CoA ligase [Clostridia bacterium]
MQKQNTNLKPSELKPWLKYVPKTSIGAEVPERTLYEHLKETCKGYMGKTALHYYGTNITFSQLLENIEKTADAFTAMGVKKGDIVSLCTVCFPETVYAFYALNKLGAISDFMDPRTHPDGIEQMIREAESDILIVVNLAWPKVEYFRSRLSLKKIIIQSANTSLPPIKKLAKTLQGGVPKVPFDNDVLSWNDFISLGKSTTSCDVPFEADSVATIVHTGGTTGFPKGVMLTNTGLNAVSKNFELSGVHISLDQKFLNIMPPFSSYGISCGVHTPLTQGLEVTLIPKFEPDKIGYLIKKYRPAHMMGVPAFYEKLINSKEMKNFDLSFFETAGSGGDTMNAALEAKLNGFLKSHGGKYPLSQGYGMSEVSAAASCCYNDTFRSLSVGIPMLTTTVAIFKPGTTEELGFNEEGEVCISGPTVMKGYFKRDDETAKVLIKHPDGKTWMHSGDMGYMDEDGFIFIKGRIKRMIIRFDGHKVFPSHIESVLAKHDSVFSCAVVDTPDTQHGQGMYPVAIVELKESHRGNEEQIKKELIELSDIELEERGRPYDIVFIDKMPRTSVGKIDYRTLPEYYLSQKK